MSKITVFWAKLRAKWCLLVSYFVKVSLPETVLDHQIFADRFIKQHGFEPTNLMKHAVASAIMHLPQTVDTVNTHKLAIHMRRDRAQKAAFEALQLINAEEKTKAAADVQGV